MAQPKSFPVNIDRGMWSSGDPSKMPDGYCISCRNLVVRPNRLEARAPFVYDTLMSVRGLAAYDDQTNKVTRLMAVDSTPRLYEKATSGDTWSASLGALTGTRLTDATNYRGVLYGMMDNGSGVPTAAFSFDGTNVNTSPFSSTIQGRTVTSYLDRNFIAYPRVTTAPLSTNGIVDCYNPSVFGQSNHSIIVSGSTTLHRWFPTSTSTPATIQENSASLAASPTEDTYIVRRDFRNNDPLNTVYATFSVSVSAQGAYGAILSTLRNTAVTVGQIGVEVGLLWRVTTAGTTSAGTPTFSGVALGGTVTDGTAVWTAERSQTIGNQEFTIPPSVAGTWTTKYFPFTMPWSTNGLSVQPIFSTSDSTHASVAALNSIDISYKDGLADGDVRKQNYGYQLTKGEFFFPFVNTETATSSTKDLNSIIWSEVQQPKRFRASATYELPEVAGYPTAAVRVGGRYIVFKRTAFWIFNGNQDATSLDVIPIRVERKYAGIGCIGPRAVDTLDDRMFFIGEGGIYHFTVGGRFASGVEEVDEICGDAMREEIMNRGANWVESQATYNMPLLKVNHRDREVWVYTQKGTIYIYRIDAKAWTKIDVAGNQEIADFFFNQNTQKMYVAVGGFGLARVDWNSASTNDTIDNTANTYTCTKDLVTKPIEMYAPRGDVLVEDVGIFHLATASQTGQTLTAYASFDRGSTFPYSDQVTLDLTSTRNRIHIFETYPTVTIKLSHVGQAGPAVWAVSKLDVSARVLGGEWPQDNPTQGTASL